MKKLFVYLPLLIVVSLFSSCRDEGFDELEKSIPQTRGVVNGAYYSLGVSYDITMDYLSPDATKYAIVDIAKFLSAPGNINSFQQNNTTTGDLKIYSGATAEDFVKDMIIKNSISINGGYTGGQTGQNENDEEKALSLSGNVKFDTDLQQQYGYSTKYSFARGDVVKRVKRVYLNATIAQLRNYLYPEFVRDLNIKTPDQFVEWYGTHVLFDITLGGRLQFNYRSVIDEVTSKSDVKKTVEAGLKFSIGKYGADAKNEYTKQEIITLKEKNSSWKTWVKYIGGEGSGLRTNYDSQAGYLVSAFDLDSWEKSVNEKNAGIIEINWNQTYPIYELIADPVKKEQIKSAVNRYIESKKIEMLELEPLYKLYNRKTGNDFNVMGADQKHYWLYVEPFGHERECEKTLGYVVKNKIKGVEPLYGIYNNKTKNTFTVIGDNEKYYWLYQEAGHKDRVYEFQTGYAYTKEEPNTIPLYRIFNRKTTNTFSAAGEIEKKYWLYQAPGRENREYDGQTGYIYPLD